MNAADIAIIRNYHGKGVPQTRVLGRDSDNNITYLAFGPRGAATSSPNWTVEKLVYENSLYSYSLHSEHNQIADNYLTLEYA